MFSFSRHSSISSTFFPFLHAFAQLTVSFLPNFSTLVNSHFNIALHADAHLDIFSVLAFAPFSTHRTRVLPFSNYYQRLVLKDCSLHKRGASLPHLSRASRHRASHRPPISGDFATKNVAVRGCQHLIRRVVPGFSATWLGFHPVSPLSSFPTAHSLSYRCPSATRAVGSFSAKNYLRIVFCSCFCTENRT